MNRPVQNLRRRRRDEGMRPHIRLAAKAAAEELTDDVDLLLGNTENDRDEFSGAEDVLRSLVECQRSIGVPNRSGRVWLHLIVVPIRGSVGLFDLNGAVGDGLFSVPDRRRHRPEELRGLDGLLRGRAIKHGWGRTLVLDTD